MNTTTNGTNTTDYFRCYEHAQQLVPGAYVFWWVCMSILFTALFLSVLTSVSLSLFHPNYKRRAQTSKQKSTVLRRILVNSIKPVNNFSVLYLCVCRFLWLLNPHPVSETTGGKLWSGPPGAEAERPAIAILISTPQVMCLLGATLLTTLWRRVTNNAQQMKRKATSIQTETIVVALATVYLVFGPLLISIISSTTEGRAAGTISNGMFGIYILILVIIAAYYILVLRKIIRKLPKESKSRRVVFGIEVTVLVLVISCLLVILGIVYDTVFVDHCSLSVSPETNSKWLVFLWLIHSGEFLGCSALLYAIWPTKHGARKKGDGRNSYSSTAGSNARKSFQSTNLEADTWVDESDEANTAAANTAAANTAAQASLAMTEKTSAYVTGGENGENGESGESGESSPTKEVP